MNDPFGKADEADVKAAVFFATVYAFIFAVAYGSRHLVNRFFGKNFPILRDFLIEFITVVQMCTCVYENGAILKRYGLTGFFVTVASILGAGIMVNGSASVNPLPVIEKFIMSKEKKKAFFHMIAILAAQFAGGALAYGCASLIWYYSQTFAPEHAELYEKLPCTIAYHDNTPIIGYAKILAYEIVGVFVIRLTGFLVSPSLKFAVVPILVSALLTNAFVMVGIPALNPLTVTSRMWGCQGLPPLHFIFLYWCGPIIGWVLAVWAQWNLYPKVMKIVSTKPKPKRKKNARRMKQD